MSFDRPGRVSALHGQVTTIRKVKDHHAGSIEHGYGQVLGLRVNWAPPLAYERCQDRQFFQPALPIDPPRMIARYHPRCRCRKRPRSPWESCFPQGSSIRVVPGLYMLSFWHPGGEVFGRRPGLWITIITTHKGLVSGINRTAEFAWRGSDWVEHVGGGDHVHSLRQRDGRQQIANTSRLSASRRPNAHSKRAAASPSQ